MPDDAEATPNKGNHQVGKATMAGSVRALEALKRSVRVVTAARHFSEASLAKGGPRRNEHQDTRSAYVVSRVVLFTRSSQNFDLNALHALR